MGSAVGRSWGGSVATSGEGMGGAYNLQAGYNLEIKNVVKRFPGVLALDNVDLETRRGEVLAVIGENGAGKSTLMKILSGALLADSGEITLDGKVIPPDTNPKSRMDDYGLGIIYQ